MRLTRYDLLGAACVLGFGVAFAAMTARRAADDGPPPVERLLDPSAEIQLGEEWLGLYFRGDRVGLIHVEKSAREGGGYRYAMQTKLRLMAMHRDAPLDLRVDADLGPDLALQRFEFEVDAGPAELAGRGEVEGTTVEMVVRTGGEDLKRRVELAHPPVLRANIGPLLSRQGLQPGARVRYHAFDPLTQRDQPVDVEVVGPETILVLDREVEATRIRMTAAGMTLDGWINARGEVLRQEMGLGLVAVRETREQARFGLLPGARGGADLIRATRVPAPGLPADLRRLSVLRLRLAGVELAGFDLHDSDETPPGRQSLADGVLSIAREPVGEGLPLPVADPPPGSLDADALVQSDHPRVRSWARSIAGGAADTLTAARRVAAWVHANVERQAVPGVPSALDTLDTRVGDCNEHAALFAALARAVGVPTRVVVGLVHADDHFAWHAWNEVLVRDPADDARRWLTVDATWDQLPADVGHVALLRGGLGEQARLLPVIGGLRVEIVEPRSPAGGL